MPMYTVALFISNSSNSDLNLFKNSITGCCSSQKLSLHSSFLPFPSIYIQSMSLCLVLSKCLINEKMQTFTVGFHLEREIFKKLYTLWAHALVGLLLLLFQHAFEAHSPLLQGLNSRFPEESPWHPDIMNRCGPLWCTHISQLYSLHPSLPLVSSLAYTYTHW